MTASTIIVSIVVAVTLCRSAAAVTCSDTVFRGFDSRLKIRPIGKVPDTSEPPIGFEIVNGHAVVAFSHRVLALDADTVVAIPSLDPITSIAVDGSGLLRLQTSKNVRQLGTERFEADSALTKAIKGRIFGSGQDSFLDAVRLPEQTQFLLTTGGGHSLALFRTAGDFRVGSWNASGLAAVIDNRLIVWQKGATQLIQLAADKGLEEARDVVLIEPKRAVVSLPHTTMLVGGDTKIVIVGVQTFCRWINDVLYLLDVQSGIIWAVEGLRNIGTAQGDENHARTLVASLARDAPESAPAFLEAARIVGCSQARAWKQK